MKLCLYMLCVCLECYVIAWNYWLRMILILQQYLDELSNVTSVQELDSYVRNLLLPQLNLPPVLGSPFLPPPGSLLPDNWTPPVALPGGLEWNTLVDQVLQGMNATTFNQFEMLVDQSERWFSLDEQPDVYTWRTSMNQTTLLMQSLKNYLDVGVKCCFHI